MAVLSKDQCGFWLRYVGRAGAGRGMGVGTRSRTVAEFLVSDRVVATGWSCRKSIANAPRWNLLRIARWAMSWKLENRNGVARSG